MPATDVLPRGATERYMREHLPEYARLGWTGLFSTIATLTDDEAVAYNLDRAPYMTHGNGGWLVLHAQQWGGKWYAPVVRRDDNAIVDLWTGRLRG